MEIGAIDNFIYVGKADNNTHLFDTIGEGMRIRLMLQDTSLNGQSLLSVGNIMQLKRVAFNQYTVIGGVSSGGNTVTK